jgi:hypothetical protein
MNVRATTTNRHGTRTSVDCVARGRVNLQLNQNVPCVEGLAPLLPTAPRGESAVAFDPAVQSELYL